MKSMGINIYNWKKHQKNSRNSRAYKALDTAVHTLDLVAIGEEPYYWVNNASLYHAQTGVSLAEITEEQALWR